MKKRPRSNRWIAITGTIALLVFILAGIIFYHNFFRQVNADLTEIVPADNVEFIFQIFDNEGFVKNSASVLPQLNKLFYMESFLGLESIIEKIETKNISLIIAGLDIGNDKKLLYGTKINDFQYRQLLQTLQIDIRNYEPWRDAKIYAYATHLRKFHLVFYHGMLIISDNMEALKKSITQFKNPVNLLTNREFRNLHQLVEKNLRHNWLLIHHAQYFANQSDSTNFAFLPAGKQFSEISQWSVFQIDINDNEVNLSGYCMANSPFFQKYAEQRDSDIDLAAYLPAGCSCYTADLALNTQKYIANLPVENTQIAYQRIQPTLLYNFSLNINNHDYFYTLLQTDSSHALTPQWENDTLPDVVYNKLITIYKTDFAISSGNGATENPYSLSYMVAYKGLYIFADSPTALKYYLDRITTDKTMASNVFYKKAHAHLPSKRCFELLALNMDSEGGRSILGAIGPQKRSFIDFKILTLSLGIPDKEWMPVSIYCQF